MQINYKSNLLNLTTMTSFTSQQELLKALISNGKAFDYYTQLPEGFGTEDKSGLPRTYLGIANANRTMWYWWSDLICPEEGYYNADVPSLFFDHAYNCNYGVSTKSRSRAFDIELKLYKLNPEGTIQD